MMERLWDYFMGIVAAAMLVAVAQSVLSTPRIRKIAALCGGAVLLLTVLSPLVDVQLGELSFSMEKLEPESAAAFSQMQDERTAQMNAIIKRTTETYILDKAEQIGAVISVEVTLAASEDGYNYPSGVTIAGAVTAHQKQVLTAYLAQELGIPAERQVWKTI